MRHGMLVGLGLMAATVLAASQTNAAPTPARLQVTADEFTLTLSRPSVRAGPAIVQLVNLGEDDHDLALRRVGTGGRTLHLAKARSGGVRELSTGLAAGRYRLWCTLGDHRTRGMTAVLIVTRPR